LNKTGGGRGDTGSMGRTPQKRKRGDAGEGSWAQRNIVKENDLCRGGSSFKGAGGYKSTHGFSIPRRKELVSKTQQEMWPKGDAERDGNQNSAGREGG